VWLDRVRGLGVDSLSLVRDVGNVARVGVCHRVGDDLGAAVREGHAVLAVGSVVITVLVCLEVGSGIIVVDAVVVVVDRSGDVLGFLVASSVGSGGMVSGSMDWGGGMVSRSVNRGWCMISWGVDRGGCVVSRGVDRS
jgi:hypothetical protein